MESIRSENLSAIGEVAHGFFTRNGGVSEGAYSSLNCATDSLDDPKNVVANRALVAQEMGVEPENLVTCQQVHSANVVEVMFPAGFDRRIKADGMVTTQKGVALGILTADCAPILFADPQARIIGAAHAGWRGAIPGVMDKVVEAMERLGAKRSAIHAAIGPCIWQESYEVGNDFPVPFLEQDGVNKDFFCHAPKKGHFLFDLPAYVLARCQRLGLASVAPSPANTYADEDRFFSYRRSTLAGESDMGRIISVIALR